MKPYDLWPRGADENFILSHSELIAGSFKKWLGRYLVPPGLSREETALAMMKAPFVIASTDTQTDPVLNYGNRTALGLWELSWSEFTATPGRHTAEPLEREARAHFMEEEKRNGFGDNYRVFVSRWKTFQNQPGPLWWNLIDEDENKGQAVMFKEWSYL
jgi:hypothetical protein